MNVVNVMNFVRRIDEREENSTERLLAFTADELSLVNEYGIDNTFLLQYDALCDEDFVALFKREATERTELGLWYEIVEPLTTACGMEYRSEKGWKWDWHIVPGFSMAYMPREREMLIDEAMRRFKEVFGYYPRTVASWLIDTHTINYLYDNYDVSAIAICRDQANTDAYTLLGGYFNQAYYPSRNNMFTPAQTEENQVSVPVFRLLGPCPIHNYDNNKYSSEELIAQGKKSACFTLEPCWYMGSNEEAVRWMLDTYYGEESLGFAYAQIGQENSFLRYKEQVLRGLRMQIELLLERGDVEFKKMGDTGEAFKMLYPKETPATAVTALNNFDSTDVQSVYYDCKNYTANLFRFEDKIFFRSLFLFDERIKDIYSEKPCTTFDAIYENLPIIDTVRCGAEYKKSCGLMLCGCEGVFSAESTRTEELTVSFGENRVVFSPDRIEILARDLMLFGNSSDAFKNIDSNGLSFEYKGTAYRLDVLGATVTEKDGNVLFSSKNGAMTIYPKRV